MKNTYSLNEAAAAEGIPCTRGCMQLLGTSEIFDPGGSVLHPLDLI